MVSRVGLIGCLIAVLAFLEGATAATTYKVGDSFGWAVPPNGSTDFYANWVSNKTFVIGDSVVFNWTGTHTATEVSKEEYDNCTKSGIILATSGVQVNFMANGTRYFLCSVGTHCEQGQKVTFVIGDGIADTGSAPSLAEVGVLSLVLSILGFYFSSYYA